MFFSVEATYMKYYTSRQLYIFLADVYFEEFLNLFEIKNMHKNKNRLTTFYLMMMLDHQKVSILCNHILKIRASDRCKIQQ